MQIKPLVSIPLLPDSVLIPMLLLTFSVVAKRYVHRQSWLKSFHSVPPRIALTSIGVLIAGASSAGSYFRVHAGGQVLLVVIQVLLLYVVVYMLCEECHASATKGGRNVLWTIVSGGLSFGLIMSATFYAQTVAQLISGGVK